MDCRLPAFLPTYNPYFYSLLSATHTAPTRDPEGAK